MQKEEKEVVVGTVIRHGTAVQVPEDMKLEHARQIIDMQIENDEMVTHHAMSFDAHPFVVAHAFYLAVQDVVGVALGKSKPGLFGSKPPQMVTVEVAPGESVQFPWGRMQFPHDPDEGWLEAGYANSDDGNVVGQIVGMFANKFIPVWRELVAATDRNLKEKSLLKGRALRVKFGGVVPSIKAWDVGIIKPSQVVFSDELEQQIEDNIYTPLRHRSKLSAVGTPFKRGVLLAGSYGTGKTVLGAVAARIAIDNGITVLYIEDVKQLPLAIRMASQLAPALVFAEDIDRVTDGERDHDVDVLLNTLDGIDTKNNPVMTILTSNYPDKIYKGMIRPGRIDVALKIEAPDSAAAQRLVKTYLGDLFDDKNGDLEEVGNALAGMIPAIIREVAERSKLSHISRTGEIPAPGSITADDVLRASHSMKNQISLLNQEPAKDTELDKVQDIVDTLYNLVDIARHPDVREFVAEHL